jgi:type I restriction enzyme, S subunit
MNFCCGLCDFFLQIHKRMNSNTGVPTLGVQFLTAIPIRRPEPDEQHRIARVLSQSETLIETERKSLRKLRSLKTALMQELLTGEKRVTPLLKLEPKSQRTYAES